MASVPADAAAAAAPAAEFGRAGAWTDERISWGRRLRDRSFWGLTLIALLLLVAPIIWILAGVIAEAAKVWHWNVLVHTTANGGLANAIVGTFVLLIGVLIIAGAVGVGFGIYISEMAAPNVASVLRSASEILSGAPSIVIGYVGYVALVVGLHWQYSLLAGYLALSVLVVPYIAKATELAISQVPLSYREGAEALGMSRAAVLRRVVMRSAIPGISTGLIVALAISVGETAPLLYTVGFSDNYPNGHLMHSSVGYLTYIAYQFWDQPSQKSQSLAHEAALILIVLVVLLILAGRLLVYLTQKYSPERVR